MPYDKNEYNNLLIKLKKTFDYWKKNEASLFNFDYLIEFDRVSDFKDSINKINSNKRIMTYYFSKPLFYNNKENVMFSVIKSYDQKLNNEDYLIIMKKKKRKWVVLEKVQNSELH